MSRSYFIELAQYNIWANNIVIGWLQQISEEQWNKEITSSFNSIAQTCVHIAGAERIWLERWQHISNPVFLFNEFKGNKNDLIQIWEKVSVQIRQFMENMKDEELFKSFSFVRLNGEANEMQYWQSFAHVINHSTYHRGQLVTMLRQAGFTNIAATDLLIYYRIVGKE